MTKKLSDKLMAIIERLVIENEYRTKNGIKLRYRRTHVAENPIKTKKPAKNSDQLFMI